MKKSRTITTIGILSALSLILYFLEIPLFIYFPPYLKIDLSDIPAILGGIALGPVAGIAIEFIKNILHFFIRNNTPFGSGEIANFFAGVGLLLPIVLTVRKNKKGSFLAYLYGTLFMTLVASIMNYFVAYPLYGLERSALLPTVLYISVPFNIIKALVVSAIVALLYRKTRRYLLKDESKILI